MSVNSRNKGKNGELEVVRDLNDNVGLTLKCAFSRQLSQTQEAGQADIACTNPAWGFSVEVKRYATNPSMPAWWRQVKNASLKAGTIPVLYARRDRNPWSVTMDLCDVFKIEWGNTNEFDDFKGELVTMAPVSFHKLAIDHSADQFFRDQNHAKAACHECGGSGSITTEFRDPTGFPYSVDIEETCRACKGSGET